MSDEEIYQRARVIIEAEIECITFQEFLPLLLNTQLPTYKYDSSINPQLHNEFSTAAYRFGHSMLPSMPIMGLNLYDMFFATHLICNQEYTVGDVLREMACGIAEELDSKVVDDIRSFLFGDPGQGGSDLVSLNIQRGRDHGLARVNDVLAACGLNQVTQFSDITSDTDLQNKLASLYASPNDIDLWVFGLVQDRGNNLLSPLFRTIISDNFMRLRDGDRLWYEARLPEPICDYIRCLRLSDIIRRNTCGKKDVPNDAFVVGNDVVDECDCPKCVPQCPKPPQSEMSQQTANMIYTRGSANSVFMKHSPNYQGSTGKFGYSSNSYSHHKEMDDCKPMVTTKHGNCCQTKCVPQNKPAPPPRDPMNIQRCKFQNHCNNGVSRHELERNGGRVHTRTRSFRRIA